MLKKCFCHVGFLALLLITVGAAHSDERYRLKPGDVLDVTVWKEPDLTREVLIAPDGFLTFPLAGTVQASGLNVSELEEKLRTELSTFITEPQVTASIRSTNGSRVFVIGKVNRPGMYLLDGPMDVMQALSLAGGTTPFADLDDVRILRREPGNEQTALPFRYNQVAKGSRLNQNVLLQSGDTVVVR